MPEDFAPDPPTRRAQATRRERGPLPLIAVGVVAVAACGLAGWSLLRSPAGTTPSGAIATYSDADRSAAKGKVCAAFTTVRAGVSQNTNLQAPGGAGDIAGALAVAANARLSLSDGGQYLLARVDPATSPELATAVREFADNLMDIGAAATAGAQNTDPEQAARLRSAETSNAAIAALCQ